MTERMPTPVITFTRAYDKAIEPMRADQSALGMMPVSAFQYCESMRVASGIGWYVFPPKTISLMFDGRETFIADEGQWRTFTHEPLEISFQSAWANAAPADLRAHAPSYIRSFSEPGVVQIWSGFFVETAPDWSLLIRPIVNAHTVSAFMPYEAIVETDSFCPMALFTNIRLIRTNSEILIERDRPLFQVSAIQRSSIEGQTAAFRQIETAAEDGPPFCWNGLMQTLRIKDVTAPRAVLGAYGAQRRRQKKARNVQQKDAGNKFE